MDRSSQECSDNARFGEFLKRKFVRAVEHATIEELPEFAFGSMAEPVKAFEVLKGKKDDS